MKRQKVDWKVKVLLSLLGGMLLVVGLLFGITYWYFLAKLQEYNEKIAFMTFRESEKKLDELMEQADRNITNFSEGALGWEFTKQQYQEKKNEVVTNREIIEAFDEILAGNKNIYGLAIVNGNGKTLVSTAERKSRSGLTDITENMRELLRESRKKYPYVLWIGSKSINIGEESTLYTAVNRPVLIGIKNLNESEDEEEDSYLFVAIDEKNVQKCYDQAIYNDSQACLLDEHQNILSSTRQGVVGKKFQEENTCQNIRYQLDYNGWMLVNMIPKVTYLEESVEIRNFGIIVALLVVSGVFGVGAVWINRYTRPIQVLMDRMESVGKEQLDIPIPQRNGWPELDQLNVQFYQMVQKLKGYIRKLQEVEKEKSKEELLALQYQMNPHFLYNSMNSIRWMAMMTNCTKVADSLVILSKIIMPVLRDPSFTWKLRDELEFLKNYIGMMRIRYEDAFEYRMECKKDLYDEEFPRFILQPVIENCFVHGRGKEGWKIEGVISKSSTHHFKIMVKNNGECMEESKVKDLNECLKNGKWTTSSVGLSNIQKRLFLLYGEAGIIQLESNDEVGVAVYIEF